jgi:tRNA (guanine37-N1)-methyltransferase
MKARTTRVSTVRIDILTLFPEVFTELLNSSIIGRAREKKLADIRVYNIRDYTYDTHHTVDDYPYGGGAGMVMKPEPVFTAVEDVRKDEPDTPVILLTPRGRLLNQQVVAELAARERFILICGHYEGVDERVAEHLSSDEISIGDYVLSGGEVAAMVVVDSVVRLIPGAVGSDESVIEESHNDGLLEYSQYTRPAEYRGWQVPEILLSGNHAEIAKWRRQQRLLRTANYRPDLLTRANLTKDDKIYLAKNGFDIIS